MCSAAGRPLQLSSSLHSGASRVHTQPRLPPRPPPPLTSMLGVSVKKAISPTQSPGPSSSRQPPCTLLPSECSMRPSLQPVVATLLPSRGGKEGRARVWRQAREACMENPCIAAAADQWPLPACASAPRSPSALPTTMMCSSLTWSPSDTISTCGARPRQEQQRGMCGLLAGGGQGTGTGTGTGTGMGHARCCPVRQAHLWPHTPTQQHARTRLWQVELHLGHGQQRIQELLTAWHDPPPDDSKRVSRRAHTCTHCGHHAAA
jgi:hypothetical protein